MTRYAEGRRCAWTRVDDPGSRKRPYPDVVMLPDHSQQPSLGPAGARLTRAENLLLVVVRRASSDGEAVESGAALEPPVPRSNLALFAAHLSRRLRDVGWKLSATPPEPRL